MFFYKIKTLLKQYQNPQQVEYWSYYLLYELNHALHVLIAASDLQFQNFNLRAKSFKM